jgi:hypothetical protein
MRIPKSLALGLIAGLAGCEIGAGPQMSHVYVRLTDAPDPAITAASAFISTVYLIGGDGTARDTITTGPSTEYDLLSLQGGVTTLIGDASIPAGDYTQLRLVVDSAKVTLDGEVDARILKVPSGMETGIKVQFAGPIHLEPPTVVVTVDFDVESSFIVTGPTPPRQVLFKPVLHGVVTP